MIGIEKMLSGESRVIKNIVFNVSDTEDLSGNRIAAYSVLIYRLNNNIWGLHRNTKSRLYINKGSKVIFYVSGKCKYSQCFVAEAEVSGIPSPFPSFELSLFTDKDNWYYDFPTYKVTLDNIQWFSNYVSIYDVMPHLDLFRGITTNKWGAFIQGGAFKISEHDYGLIKKRSGNNS